MATIAQHEGGVMELQPIPLWPADIETVPPGLYFTPEEKRGDVFDGPADEWMRDSALVLLIRVDDGAELPCGVEAAYFRKDGRRIVKAWVTKCSLERAIPNG
jgi:hypothetical protein